MRANQQTLDNLWVRTRHRLYMLANGKIANYDVKTSGKSDASKPPDLHDDITELEGNWAQAKTKKAKREVLWSALELVFYYAPRGEEVDSRERVARRKLGKSLSPSQQASLPYMPAHIQDRLRLRIHGRKLMQQRQARTKEWRYSVATAEGTVKSISVLYGVPERTVKRWRAEFRAVAHTNGHRFPRSVSQSTYKFIRDTIRQADILGRSEER